LVSRADRILSVTALVAALLSLLVTAADVYPRAKANFFPEATCANPRGLTPVRDLTATATSTLASDGDFTYIPGNAVDGNATTAWAPAGGDGGNGKQLLIHLASAENLRLACVINGYAKDGDLYLRNARMRDVTVQTDTGHVTGTLTDLPPEQSHQFQDLPLPKGRTSLVGVTITSYYSGTSNNGQRAHLDSCVSEVMLYRV
jgi:hypothetical protein